jgi:HPt (histidine-containing phosphotransfer) domain-containing protein
LELEIDLEVLKAMIAMSPDDPEFVFQVIDAFLQDVPQQLKKLREYQANGLAKEMGMEAHVLKSGALTMGLGPLSELCSELDQRGRAGSLDGSAELVAKIGSGFEAAKIRLEAILKKRSIT